jgi:hypothetical protein
MMKFEKCGTPQCYLKNNDRFEALLPLIGTYLPQVLNSIENSPYCTFPHPTRPMHPADSMICCSCSYPDIEVELIIRGNFTP